MAGPAGAPTALVAEDDPLLLRLLSEAFAELGFRVHAARDGWEALAWAEREPPDLVLTDYDMPQLDGLALCRRLHARPPTRSVPLVLISGMLREAMPELACADAFLPKPFSLDELEATVEQVLGRA